MALIRTSTEDDLPIALSWFRSALSMLVDLIGVTLGIIRIRAFTNPSEINVHEIYTTAEAAKLVGTDRVSVIRLIHSGELHAKKARGNYRIAGQSIMRYLLHKDAVHEETTEAKQPESPPRKSRKPSPKQVES